MKYVGLPFTVSGVHPSVFTEKKFDYLVSSGMIRVRMGIQTGSQKILEIYGRKQDNETVIKVSQILQKYSKKLVMPVYDVIVDNPWETREDKLKTIELLEKMAPPFTLNIYSLVFFPGTNLYSRATQMQLVNEKTKFKHYLNCEPSHINLVIALFGLFKVPRWLLKLLLSKRLINTKRSFLTLHRIIFKLTIYRKGICSLLRRDFSMFPPAFQSLYFKLFPSKHKKIIS